MFFLLVHQNDSLLLNTPESKLLSACFSSDNEWQVRCIARPPHGRQETNTESESISGLGPDVGAHGMDVITGKGKEKETIPLTEHGNGHTVAREENEREREEEAAVVVQRAWRHHSMRKKQLNSDARWKDALVSAKKQINYDAAQGNEKNDTKSRWKRGVFLAGRLQDGDAVMAAGEEESTEQAPLHTKSLETQHWLELVDPKHRYGSNLKWYHQRWAEADTPDNFFRWLDRGEGKEVSLPECSRDQLESERIIYLSAEQRLNYLVMIDSDGKLRWKRNSQYVDTAPEMWIDAGEGRGIVRSDGSDEVHIRPRVTSATAGSFSEEQTAKHYQGTAKDPNLNAFQRIWKDRFTTKGLMERLLRKTVRKNTWLYVSDKNYNIFIGLKETGYFQHSSLTAGGLVTSAGLIEIKDGLVTSISPLSGHYRTSIEHFKQFIHAMEERGLDTHKVHMTKGEAMLWGLEHWKGFQKSTKESKKQLKHAAHRIVHPNEAREEKLKSEEKAKEDESARSKYEEAQHTKATSTASSSLKPEDVKDKALRERIEKMWRRKEQEDEQWKSGSQWRWEVITGRAQKSVKEKEQKWRSAMESVAPSASKTKAETIPGKEDLLHPAKTADPEATNATTGAIPSTVLTRADSGYASGSAATQASSQALTREPGSEVPKVETVPEESSPGTPKDRPPSYDNYEGVTSLVDKSSS